MSSAAETLLEIAKTVGPAVTGVGGALATIWKTTHSTFNRLSSLEKDSAQCKERHKGIMSRFVSVDTRIDDVEKNTRGVESGVDGLMSSLSKAVTELSTLRASMSSYMTQTQYSKMLERMASLERRVSDLDDAISRQDTTMINFAREQHEQWQGINRSLGQLERFIKGRASAHPDD